MLVLKRKRGESIFIGDDVKITVLPSDKDGEVRIGIDAPKTVIVDREEIRERKLAEIE